MAMDARQKRAVAKAAEIISRTTTTDADAEAAMHGIRRILAATGLTLAQVMGGEELERLRVERDQSWQAYDRLRRRTIQQMAERMTAANQTRTAAADQHAVKVMRVISQITRGHQHISTDEIAAELSRRGVQTARGGTAWTRMQVHRVRARMRS